MARELLVYDDDPDVLNYIADVARGQDYTVHPVGKTDEFWTSFDQVQGCAIVLDMELEQTNGIAILHELAERNCNAPILLISGYHSEILKSAARLGTKDGLDVRGALQKPFHKTDLVDQLSNLE